MTTTTVQTRVWSPATQHFMDCATYCTLDASDCTCICAVCDNLGATTLTIGSFTADACDEHVASALSNIRAAS